MHCFQIYIILILFFHVCHVVIKVFLPPDHHFVGSENLLGRFIKQFYTLNIDELSMKGIPADLQMLHTGFFKNTELFYYFVSVICPLTVSLN